MGRDEEMLLLAHDLYASRSRDGYAGGLEPDLLGEGMVRRALYEERGEAGAFLGRVFDSASAVQLQTGFEVLGRMSVDYPEEARGWIASVLGSNVADRALPALEAAKNVRKSTAHAVLGQELAAALERGGTGALAESLWAAGLPEDTVSLREVGLWTTAAFLQALPPGDEEHVLAQRAALLNDLADRQNALGKREAALASVQEAVDHYRKLAASRPEIFQPFLATALANLGNAQLELDPRRKGGGQKQTGGRRWAERWPTDVPTPAGRWGGAHWTADRAWSARILATVSCLTGASEQCAATGRSFAAVVSSCERGVRPQERGRAPDRGRAAQRRRAGVRLGRGCMRGPSPATRHGPPEDHGGPPPRSRTPA